VAVGQFRARSLQGVELCAHRLKSPLVGRAGDACGIDVPAHPLQFAVQLRQPPSKCGRLGIRRLLPGFKLACLPLQCLGLRRLGIQTRSLRGFPILVGAGGKVA